MPISTQDIKLFASKVMSDVPEGGGGPTGKELQSGKSNNIFRDIREQDRAGGNLSMRQVHLGITSGDTDVAMGCNVIISEPPDDPNVSVVLMSTASDFATREQDLARLEAGYIVASTLPGVLFGDHVQGMRTLILMQSVSAAVPEPNDRLALVFHEGQGDSITQYVSILKVESVEREFEDGRGAYKLRIVTLSLGQGLSRDYPGFDAQRESVPGSSLNARTRIRSTIWGNAARYYGIQPLVNDAPLGGYTVQAAGIHAQLVPSAQAETPLLDIYANGRQAGLVATGGAVTRSITQVFSATVSMFLGGPVLPGSLSIVRGSVELVDKGGLLLQAGSEVGQVDYENGLLTLSGNVWGTTGGTHGVQFVPAAVPQLISRQRAISVTPQGQSLSYAFVLDGAPPLPQSVVVSYLAQGRWYVLRDDGAGVLRGQDSAWGVGTVNYQTGAVLLSLGTLPDIGSIILVQCRTDAEVALLDNTTLLDGGAVYAPINTSGQNSDERGAKPIRIGACAIQWADGSGIRTAVDDGFGNLTGDATGRVDYGTGVVRISPNALPPPGTVFLLDTDSATPHTAANVSFAGGSLGVDGIEPGSVSFSVEAVIAYNVGLSDRKLAFGSRAVTLQVFDDGAGALKFVDPGNSQQVACGSVDYGAGTITISSLTPGVGRSDVLGPPVNIHSGFFADATMSWNQAGSSVSRALAITSVQATVAFATAGAGTDSVSVAVDSYQARVFMVPGYHLQGVSFALGGSRYQQMTAGTLMRDQNTTTGQGTPAGSVSASSGTIFVQAWPVGAAPTLMDMRGIIVPGGVGVEAPFTAFTTMLRTAAAPLRPGSFSLQGNMQDGTAINVTAAVDGTINSPRVKGRVDVQYGFAELYFVDPGGSPELAVDLSHLGIPGLSSVPADLVMLDTLRYSAVSYEYIPVDPEVIGVNPVRLPGDGRVVIFNPGDYVVVHTHDQLPAQAVTDNQQIALGVERLSRIVITGSDGKDIQHGWARDLDAGTLHILDCHDWPQPVTIAWSIEHMALVREAQIGGQITLNRPLTHHFPAGKSFVSSALMLGDRYARVSLLFDQANWDGVSYLDYPSGNVATATFNDTAAPVEVDNTGAITQRWAIQFLSANTVRVVGESVGVVVGNHLITEDLAPINPNTGTPYFVMRKEGWGSGWTQGNLVRLNTVGAGAGFCLVRAVQPGDYSSLDHRFSILARVDVDRPGAGE